jgi:predicted transcriptional regulator
MVAMTKTHLTKCELEVMDVVWRKGRATVQEVVDSLERPLAYTTVMTTLKILDETRGVVRKQKKGRAYEYEPTVSREMISRSMAADLTERLFGGSVKSLVLSLVEGDSMSQSDIEELKLAIQSLEADA